MQLSNNLPSNQWHLGSFDVTNTSIPLWQSFVNMEKVLSGKNMFNMTFKSSM